ncbi:MULTISPECIES: tail fiber protein [unclassified Ensifer]|uniref:tail fiber protein n=1 Tax=unclassified Ensifer TaxID=2633371 RepID=UPI0007C75FC9|nr:MULTISPECIES: tail fiber protein [unclassified Ensifer]
MPRTGGVYSPPAGTKGVPNTTIQSVPYNTLIDDLTADANAPRPVTAGGTGATSASGARTALGVEIGTNVQAYDAALQSIAGQTTVANQILYTTATDAYATTALTPFARDLLGDATAAAMKTRLGLAAVASSGSAEDLTTGKLADARLPTIMSGKTFAGTVTASGLVTVAPNQGIDLGPINTANTPFIDFHSAGTGTDYDARILANGGNATSGNGGLTYIANGGHCFTGDVVGGYAKFSNVLTGNAVVTTNGEFIARSSGDRVLWFRTPSDVNRGLVYHQNSSGSLRLSLFNTSGGFQQEYGVYENGVAIWSGQTFLIGGSQGSSEYRMDTNVVGHSYRMLGLNDGHFKIQRSADRFVSNAPDLVWWDASNTATFSGAVLATSFLPSSSTPFGAGNGLTGGSGDNATFATHNVRVSTWFGVGIWDSSSNACRIVLNARSGSISMLGELQIGNARLFADGNVQFASSMQSSFGNYLSDALNARAGIYTGSNRDETNFPIGHTILVETGNGDIKERNSAHAIYLSSSYGYAFGGAGAQLAGTWRARGGYDSPGSGAWTYCFVRTA